MSSMNARVMASELRMWWTLSTEGWALRRADEYHPRIKLIRDEAEAIAMYTDWPRLKGIVERTVDGYDKRIAKRKAELAKKHEVRCVSLA